MREKYKEEIESFKKDIGENKDISSIKDAVDQAYQDAKRTFSGIGKYESEKVAAFDEMEESLKKYFNGTEPKDKEEYNTIHIKWCKSFIKQFEPSYKVTYGQAQKIVNMAMKYILCYEVEGKDEKYFEFCHMPLDSYILAWYNRNVAEKGHRIDTSWSKLGEEEYLEIQDSIKAYCNDWPIFEELSIWRTERIESILKPITKLNTAIKYDAQLLDQALKKLEELGGRI